MVTLMTKNVTQRATGAAERRPESSFVLGAQWAHSDAGPRRRKLINTPGGTPRTASVRALREERFLL